MSTFNCDCCGVCCKNIRHSIFYTEEFDRGDGVCKHLTAENLCAIYATRPLFCNIDAYYDKYLSHKMSREAFHKLNYAACRRLKNQYAPSDTLESYDKLLAFIAATNRIDRQS